MRWFNKNKTKLPQASKPSVKEGNEAVPQAATHILLGSLSLVSRPHQSEKAVRLEQANQYTLAMLPGAQKNELKKQLEKAYGVHVLKISSVRLPGKKVRQRNHWGQRSDRRYFRVRLKTGEVLDVNKVKK